MSQSAPVEATPIEAAELPYEPVAARPEPMRLEPEVRPIARIVDPSVADEDDLEPLFPQSTHYADTRRQKGGWLGRLGRARQDAPQTSLRSGSSAQAALQVAPEEPATEGDDLEIPSFLRRLAN